MGYMPIKNVFNGDKVLSYNSFTGEYSFRNVIDTVVQEETDKLQWFELEFSNGKKIVCTEDHPFLTQRGWIMAKDLTDNDNIVSIE